MEEEKYIGFANYSEGKKPYGFYISHAKALFHKGLKVRYTRESTAGINCIMARHNRHTSYDVYTSPKTWQVLNKNY